MNCGRSLCQLDVNNTFLQGHLSEHICMAQPQGFVDLDNPSYVSKLHKAIYGLKQVPLVLYHELRIHSGFKNSHANSSLFIFTNARQIMYLLIYVDDSILTGDSVTMVNKFVVVLAQMFSLKDFSLLNYFWVLKLFQINMAC